MRTPLDKLRGSGEQDRPPGRPAAGARRHYFFRNSRAKAEWHEEDHPRADDGRFGDKPGTHEGGGAAAKPRRAGAAAAKHVARLERYTNLAVRRRVLHGLRNEAELARALDAHNLPDSEPADVVLLAGPDGEIVADAARVKDFLRRREAAVAFLRRWRREPGQGAHALALRDKARALVEDHTLLFFECKTLIVQQGAGAVHMSAKARRRKERWEERFAAPFFTVAFDDRRGHKHSGHRLYYRRGVGSVKLSAMERVADFGDLLGKVGG